MPKIEMGIDDDCGGIGIELKFENTLEGNESAKMVMYGLRAKNVGYLILTPEEDNVAGLVPDEIWFR